MRRNTVCPGFISREGGGNQEMVANYSTPVKRISDMNAQMVFSPLFTPKFDTKSFERHLDELSTVEYLNLPQASFIPHWNGVPPDNVTCVSNETELGEGFHEKRVQVKYVCEMCMAPVIVCVYMHKIWLYTVV